MESQLSVGPGEAGSKLTFHPLRHWPFAINIVMGKQVSDIEDTAGYESTHN